MIELAIGVALGIVAGAVAALKIIAPKTATKKDDKLLERLEAVEKFILEAKGGPSA